MSIIGVTGAAAALVMATLASSATATPAADGKNAMSDDKVAAIAADCARTNDDCLAHFDRFSRSAKEHSAQGGFNLFGIVKGSGLTFWGAVEELTYTEVKYALPGDGAEIEFQIGFGYILYAKQRDAKLSTDGIVGNLAISADGDIGRTRYWAAIVGLAEKDDTDCAKASDKTELKTLLCSIDMQPTITQAYFTSAAGKIAVNYDAWRQLVAQNHTDASIICPQVINYRYADRSIKTEPDKRKVAGTVLRINTILMAKCANPRPNAVIRYTNGDPINPNGTASGGGEDVGGTKRDLLSQGYYRDAIFLAGTRKRDDSYFLPRDQFAEVTVTGVTDSESLPSILASIISYRRTDRTQRLVVGMGCSNGAGSVSVADDPVSNPIAFTRLMLNIRLAVDRPDGRCA